VTSSLSRSEMMQAKPPASSVVPEPPADVAAAQRRVVVLEREVAKLQDDLKKNAVVALSTTCGMQPTTKCQRTPLTASVDACGPQHRQECEFRIVATKRSCVHSALISTLLTLRASCTPLNQTPHHRRTSL